MTSAAGRRISPSEMEDEGVGRWVWVSLVAVVVLAMGRVVLNHFSSWDDPQTIWMNPAFNPPTFAKVMRYWDINNSEAGLWVPVTYTLWGGLAKLAWLTEPGERGERLSPMVFHGASLMVHVVSTLIVFAIIRRLVLRDERRQASATVCAWVGAAVFGVHPLQVEAIGWASGLKDLLWVLCALGAVYCYMRSTETGLFWRSRWWWVGLVVFGMGSLCKPTAMVTPALAAAVHWLGMRRPVNEVVRGIWPWFLLVPVIGWWTRQIQHGLGIPTLAAPMRPLIALDALAFYLWKLVLPAGMSFDYGRTPTVALETGYLWWTWVAPAGVAIVLAWKRRASWLALAGAVWAVIAMLPVSGIIPFLFQYYTTVADHYVYGSMAGVGMAAAMLVARLGGQATRKVAAPVIAAVLVVWIALSIRQMGVWEEDKRLYTHALSINPRSFASWTNLGGDQMVLETRRRRKDPRNVEQAIEYVNSALAVNPVWTKAHDIKTVALILLGRIEEATTSAEKVLETAAMVPPDIRGHMMVGRQMFGVLLLRQGRREAAIRQFELAIKELDLAPPENREKDRKKLEELIARALETPAPTHATTGQASRPTTR